MLDHMAWNPLTAVRRPERPPINLALQGGGAHGAFTWGVLDALLEADRFTIAGLSGTSAGAMNAVVLAHGLRVGGAAGAREALARFWTELGSGLPFDWLVVGAEDSLRLSPVARMVMRWSQAFAPHQLNPLGHDPLRELLAAQVDFDALRRHADGPRLAIAATQARSGRLKVFDNERLGIDAVLASACLPTLHQTVLIDGEPYWDGGYSANPALFPLLTDTRCATDTLMVLLAPRCMPQVPRKATEIRERAVEIAFQAAFLRELDGLQALQADAPPRWWPGGRLQRRIAQARWHLVDGAPVLAALAGETRLIAHRPFLERLRDAGRDAAHAWMAAHGDAVGRTSSITLAEVIERPASPAPDDGPPIGTDTAVQGAG